MEKLFYIVLIFHNMTLLLIK